MSSRILRAAGLLVFASALAGCASINVGLLPTDTSSKITGLVTEAQDAKRASDVLGWGRTVRPEQMAAKPADMETFTGAICAEPFFEAAVAAKGFQAYNEQVTSIAKAPDESLSAYLRSIRKSDESIAASQNRKPAKDYVEARMEAEAKCREAVRRDLAIQGGPEPAGFPFVAAVAALKALIAIPTKVAQVIETQKRAVAVKEYVIAHEAEMDAALKVLEEGSLENAIQATRSYHVRRAYAHYSDLAPMRAVAAAGVRPSAPLLADADAYAQFVARYLKLQDASAAKLVSDPEGGLRAAYARFVKAVKEPNSDPLAALDSFLLALKNVSELGGVVEDYKTKRGEATGGGS